MKTYLLPAALATSLGLNVVALGLQEAVASTPIIETVTLDSILLTAPAVNVYRNLINNHLCSRAENHPKVTTCDPSKFERVFFFPCLDSEGAAGTCAQPEYQATGSATYD